MKRKGIIITMLLCACMGAGSTLGLLVSDTETVVNVFEPAYVNIGVVEKSSDSTRIYEDPDNTVTYAEASAGVELEKKVWIKNIDRADFPTTDTFVRVCLVPVVRDSDGNGTGIAPQIDYGLTDSKNWVKYGSYYYYKEVLSPGELSDQLLRSVTLREALPEGTHLELQVLSDAVAAGPQGSEAEETWVYEAWGVYPPGL